MAKHQYTPSEMAIYQRRSDFFTFWLHDILHKDEISLDVKRNTVSHVIVRLRMLDDIDTF